MPNPQQPNLPGLPPLDRRKKKKRAPKKRDVIWDAFIDEFYPSGAATGQRRKELNEFVERLRGYLKHIPDIHYAAVRSILARKTARYRQVYPSSAVTGKAVINQWEAKDMRMADVDSPKKNGGGLSDDEKLYAAAHAWMCHTPMGSLVRRLPADHDALVYAYCAVRGNHEQKIPKHLQDVARTEFLRLTKKLGTFDMLPANRSKAFPGLLPQIAAAVEELTR